MFHGDGALLCHRMMRFRVFLPGVYPLILVHGDGFLGPWFAGVQGDFWTLVLGCWFAGGFVVSSASHFRRECDYACGGFLIDSTLWVI